MRVGLYTLGCKVSQYETEAIAEEMVRRGFTVADFNSPSDAYVINTCTVTAESDRKSRQIIRRAIASNPDAVVAVIGCYTQRAAAEVAAIPGVKIVLGTADKMKVCELIERALAEGERFVPYISVSDLSAASFEPMCVIGSPRTRAYVKIEDGCEARCTYCAIADARGRVRSKPRCDVISEVRGLVSRGVREVVLTGIETGSYGIDFEERYRLSDLILELSELGFPERIRLGSLAPELCGEEFARAVAKAQNMAPHFHLSVQSGSNKILRAMKRRYNRERALENIERLREYIPGAQFTTDLMVGFPGESDEDFIDTVDLLRHARFISAHVFAYSRRRGTPAASYEGQLPEGVKRERSAYLISEAHRVRDGVLSGIVEAKKPLRCILEAYREGMLSAHSDEFFEVAVTGSPELSGKYVEVIPVSHKEGIIYGDITRDL